MAGMCQSRPGDWDSGNGGDQPQVAVSHAPDRHKADGGLNVLQDDQRAASSDCGNGENHAVAAE